jgi:hypothetical protein
MQPRFAGGRKKSKGRPIPNNRFGTGLSYRDGPGRSRTIVSKRGGENLFTNRKFLKKQLTNVKTVGILTILWTGFSPERRGSIIELSGN